MRAFGIPALAVSVGLHLAFAAAWLAAPEEEGAKDQGLGGVEVAVAGIAGTPVAAVPAPADAPPPVPAEAARPVEPEAAAAPVLPPEEPVAARPADDQGERVVASTADEASEVAPEPIARPVPPPPKVTAREPEPPPAPPKRQPRPQPEKPRPPTPTRTAEAPAAEPAPPSNADGTPSDTPARRQAGAAAVGGGDPGREPGYLDRLSGWLARHREYPRLAQVRRQEGTATLRFTVDRGGRVLSREIARSSGVASLDRAAEDMLERAQPIPTPPDMGGDRLELVIPVRFYLR